MASRFGGAWLNHPYDHWEWFGHPQAPRALGHPRLVWGWPMGGSATPKGQTLNSLSLSLWGFVGWQNHPHAHGLRGWFGHP